MTSFGRIQWRRDDTASWAAVDPILLAGEVGFNTTNGLFKIGNNVSHWNALPYFGSGNAFAALIVWDAITSKPPFVAEGATQEAAREVIDAASPQDISDAINALINAAPGTLDTLGEIAALLASADVANLTTLLAGKQPIDADLTAIAALTGNDQIAYRNSSGVWVTAPITALGRGLVNTADAAAVNALLPVALNWQTTHYTIVAADYQRKTIINSVSDVELRVPTNATLAVPLGTVVPFMQWGAGKVNVVAVSPGTTTVVAHGGKTKTTDQYAGGVLTKVLTDTWTVEGNLVTP